MGKGNFTLLTSLTLNAAGFDKGIASAKKQSKALADGVQTAGSAMKSAFSGIGGLAGEAGDKLGGIANMATGGISAFKKMVPAINGVKVAIVSTGIGAIVVAIGMAFAALSSYLNGTSEGASKLNKILAVAKGVFNAVLQRVQLLGEAVSLVFEGKFKEAGKKLKEAFAGGLLEEAREDAKAMVALAERENQLWKAKVDWKVKESELQIKLDEAKLAVEDKDKSTLERQKALVAAQQLQTQISLGRIGIAQEELSILKTKNSLGNKSREDIEKEADLQVALNLEMAKKSSSQKELMAKQAEINGALKTQLQTMKDQNEVEKARVGSVDILGMNGIKAPNLDKTALQEYKGELLGLNTVIYDFGVMVQNNLVAAINTMSSAFMQGGNSFRDYAKNIKSAIKQTIGAFLAEGVAAMVGNALKSSAKLGPIGLALAPALAALAGGLAKTAFNSLVPKFALGGVVGGSSFSGDRVPAMVNSGEMILNRSQQANLFRQLNGGFGGGELSTRVSGSDLLFVLNNAQRRSNSYR